MSSAGYVRRWQVWTTVAMLLLGVAATALGLFREGFYKDPYALRLQAYGQDLVTLGVILPALAVGLRFAARGSLRGYFLWLGALGYVAYTYLVYSFVTQFNWFFLGYVALFGLSTFTLVAGVLRIDADAVKERLEPALPTRPIAGFFAVMGALVALLWLSEAVPATLANAKPPSAADVGLPANVVHALDLGVVIPAMFVTANWLRRGEPWGYVLPGVLFVKVVSIGIAVLGMIAWMAAHGEPVAAVEVGVFTLVTAAGIAVGAVYFRAIRPPASDERPPVVPES